MDRDMMNETAHREALNQWMRDYGTGLLRMNFLYLKDLQLAEDVTQETFFRAYREYGTFRGESSVKSWLTRIAINLCKDQRKQAWFQRVDRREWDAQSEPPDEERSVPGTEEEVLEHQRNQELLEAVMELPPKNKEVLLMYYYQELKVREIAAILKIPEKTAASRLERGRRMLKERLKGWSENETEIG